MDSDQRRTLVMMRLWIEKSFRRVTEHGWLSLESKKTKGNMVAVFYVSIEYRKE